MIARWDCTLEAAPTQGFLERNYVNN
jgi:hypothetical protein